MELVQRMNLSYSWRTLLVYPLLPAKKNKKDRREYIFLLIGLLHSPFEYSGICSHLYDDGNECSGHAVFSSHFDFLPYVGRLSFGSDISLPCFGSKFLLAKVKHYQLKSDGHNHVYSLCT